jgi:hypothetical protein
MDDTQRAELRERILESARRHFRIGPGWEPTDFYERGRRCARNYWNGPHRHPTTPLRALLRETRTTREWLDASWGHFERTREINAELERNPSYADELTGRR